ncbi:TonB-dependent receptor [Pacificimonas sp. WHA3]|uniref:TonB-dependent receptor n=1 Tax=Pacificimonas pallii TaxID=2827236 RepID=A0ABS6SD67_9SPHN|nr:TonB-dependent receptor [Pacificimonas pallii]MBV7255866.1 TonB-dependent receptor [Pacificimonas pallii]
MTALATAIVATPTYAQVQDQTSPPPTPDVASSAQDEQTIVVTGSRIRRSNANSAIPVQILVKEDIQSTGSVDVAEIVTEIPGVDYSLSPENTALSTQNAGLSTVNLRRLGGNRTLTLIDGRRAVSNSGNGERVSLSTIPTGFIKAVEVTTGGASAIYGSDAIAGVVNLLLEDDFEGLDLYARYGEAEASGEEETRFTSRYGKRFADDRIYMLFGFDYWRETAIFADATRPGSIANVEFNRPNRSRLPGQEDNPDAFGSEIAFGDCDNSGKFCINPSGSSYLPGGVFEGDDAWNVGGVWFNDQSLLPQDGRLAAYGFETDSDGFNFRPGTSISPSFESFTGGWLANFDMTPTTSLSAELYYSHIDTTTTNSASAAFFGTDIGVNNALGDIGTMAADNPFIPPEVEETRIGRVSWYRRFSELGNRKTVNKRQTIRGALSLDGQIWDDWEWTLGGTFGRFDQKQRLLNYLNYLNIRNALNVETVNGSVQCADADARADGCVPLNIFGEGSITPQMADYIRYTGRLRQNREQLTFGGSMNGELFDLSWSGPVRAAFGFEWREESQETYGDPDNGIELTSLTPIPDIRAQFSVWEAFGELDIPLITDQLSVQLAARYADYTTVGSVFSYNIGGTWQPIPDIRFRAQYSRSQRAPTLTEFFSPARGDFDSLRDPCDGLLPDGSGITPAPGSTASADVIAANCLAEPGIQAYFADVDNAGEPFEYDGSVSGPNAGNNLLQEETADTYTAGVVLAPRFLPGFSLIVDYYNITVNDAIGSVSTQLTADLCYGDTNFPNNRFCDVITRDGTTGNVIQVINRQENLNSLKAEGVDATLAYRIEPGFIPGAFRANVRYTHYLTDDFTFLGIGGPETVSSNGEIGEPEDEFRAQLSYDLDGFSASWTTIYRGGGVDDLDVPPTDPEFFRAPDEIIHNLYLRYRFGEEPRVSVFGGVRNVFDDIGPIIPNGVDNGGTRNITGTLNDVEGREFYAGVQVRF